MGAADDTVEGKRRCAERTSRTSVAPPQLLSRIDGALSLKWSPLALMHHYRRCIRAERIAPMRSLIEFTAYAVLTVGNLVFVRVIAVKGKLPKD